MTFGRLQYAPNRFVYVVGKPQEAEHGGLKLRLQPAITEMTVVFDSDVSEVQPANDARFK